MPHRGASAELEHEGHVLEQQPARALLALNQTEHLVDQAGTGAGDACGLAGLREVLAGEAGGDQFGVTGEGTQLSDVTSTAVGKRAEDGLGSGIDFHSSSVFHPCSRAPTRAHRYRQTNPPCSATTSQHPSSRTDLEARYSRTPTPFANYSVRGVLLTE